MCVGQVTPVVYTYLQYPLCLPVHVDIFEFLMQTRQRQSRTT